MHNSVVMLARSKLNSIESKTSEALMNNQISHKDFMTIINEERNYRKLKQSIRMMKSQDNNLLNIKKCSSKKSKFIKEQEGKVILTSLGFKTGLDKIPFIGDYLL